MVAVWLLLVFFLNILKGQKATFRFGNTNGDYMVLQQAPYRAEIWGFSSPNDTISVSLSYQSNFSMIENVTTLTNPSNSVWKVYLSPRYAKNDMEYIITATSITLNKKIQLTHILYGDVFICSGQSNMQFAVDNAFNASEEVIAANNYPNIRVFTINEQDSNKPELEITDIEEQWSISNSSSIGGGNWTYFSAVCWFFGRDLYEYLNYPLGLVDTSFGGTPIRAWMSNDARAICNESTSYCNTTDLPDKLIHNYADVPDSSLWNAMIYPFLQTTIKGAIWYQGERDSKEHVCATQYHCAFPTMINSWRENWHLMSDTDPLFPFGYVQLSTWNDNTQNETCTSPKQHNDDDCLDIGVVRWAFSANYGYVPNKLMPNTFMAGSIDLGDPNSPWGDIHPRYKQPVGQRLANAAKNVIYGESDIYWQGPIATNFTVDVNKKIGIITFRNVGEMGFEIKNNQGFEFYVDSNNSWITIPNTTFSSNGNYEIIIPIVDDSIDVNAVSAVRFLWFHAPCYPVIGPYNCPIYDKQFQLPALPFIMNLTAT